VNPTVAVERTRDEIEEWLLARLRTAVGDAEQIKLDHPLGGYLLDSSVAVRLTLDLSRWLHVDLPITLFWERPTVRSLADALVKMPPHEPPR
jgi:acyl carrier protein